MDIRGFFGGFGGGKKPAAKKESPNKKRKQEIIQSNVPASTSTYSIDATKTGNSSDSAIDISSTKNVEIAEENKPPSPKRQKAITPDKTDKVIPIVIDAPESTAACTGPFVLPKGKPLCLQGSTFVITGLLPNLSREAAGNFIMTYGGSVRTAVSSKTTYLLCGPLLEDGRPVTSGKKHKKAIEKKIKIISEEELLKMVRDTYDPFEATPSTSSSLSSFSSSLSSSSSSSASSTSSSNSVSGRTAASENDVRNNEITLRIQSEAQAARDQKVDPKDIAARKSTMLWADKHKPKRLEELLGNGGHIRSLKNWLDNWEGWHVKKNIPIRRPNSRVNSCAKAALVSGPPGIGKSSSAALIARSMGYEVMELNASDARSKKLLQSSLSDVTQNTVLSFGTTTKKKIKRLIVMDEVDGMSSGDRGGIQALIAAIKTSKTPIICICNDAQKSSVRSLANHCLALSFARPQRGTIVKRLMDVAKKEGMNVEPNALDFLVQSTGGDIRQILNSMQMWNSGRNGSMTFANVQARKSEIGKDEIQRISVFDAASHLLACPRNTSFCKKRDELFFVDYSIMPLFIHMNYPNSILAGNHSKNNLADVMSEAADLVAEADMYDTYIRQRGRWDLLTKQAVTVAAVGFKTRGRVGRCEFPETLGKMSTMGKRKRLLSEFVVHTGMRTLSSTSSMRLDYLIPLREHCMRPLSSLRNVEGAKQSVSLLQEYGFTRDDAFENLPEFGLGNKKGGELFSGRGSSLESKVKTAFTRHFNSTGRISAGQLATISKQADRDKLLIKEKKKRKNGSSSSSNKRKK